MLKRHHKKSGQAVVGEYVLTTVIVAVAISAMVTYVRRTIQARTHDAHMKMISDAESAKGGGVGTLAREYEPYYSKMTQETDQFSSEKDRTVSGKYLKEAEQTRQVDSESLQYPPAKAKDP